MVGDKYESIPKEVVAVRWEGPQDHPDVKLATILSEATGQEYRCGSCGRKFNESAHGELYTNSGNKMVCSGDWILSDNEGYRVVPHETFIKNYRKK